MVLTNDTATEKPSEGTCQGKEHRNQESPVISSKDKVRPQGNHSIECSRKYDRPEGDKVPEVCQDQRSDIYVHAELTVSEVEILLLFQSRPSRRSVIERQNDIGRHFNGNILSVIDARICCVSVCYVSVCCVSVCCVRYGVIMPSGYCGARVQISIEDQDGDKYDMAHNRWEQ